MLHLLEIIAFVAALHAPHGQDTEALVRRRTALRRGWVQGEVNVRQGQLICRRIDLEEGQAVRDTDLEGSAIAQRYVSFTLPGMGDFPKTGGDTGNSSD